MRGGLSAAELASLRDLLATQRADLTGQVAALERELAGIIDAAALVASDDEHDPDGATIAFERAHVAALLSHARNRLAALGRARERFEDGTYGTCERCGGPIGVDRLAARPATAVCIGCAASGRP
jgi:DnaK suppressor protein